MVLKLPTPVASGHPTNTNQTLIQAHRTALSGQSTNADFLVEAGARSPNFLVVYPNAVGDDVYGFLERCSGTIDSLIFVEGLAGSESSLVTHGLEANQLEELSRRYDLCIVRIVYAGYEETFAEPLASSTGFVYLAVSTIPGGPVIHAEALQRSIDRIKLHRPDLPLVVGFGIKTLDQVRALSAVDGIDGLTVGTWLYQAQEDGFEAFKQVFDGLYASLQRG